MSKERRRRTGWATFAAAILTAAVSISIPATAAGQSDPVGDLLKGVDGLVKGVTGQGAPAGGGDSSTQAAPAPAADDRAGVPPNYTPPLHGTQPHGQGTVAVGDLLPSNTLPLGSDPATGEEELIVGDAAGYDNGTYNGRVTLIGANLLGIINTYNIPGVSDLLNVTTTEGQTKNGPLAPLQGAIDSVCTSIPGNAAGCIQLAGMNSSSTPTGSTNSFSTLSTDLSVAGIADVNTGVVQSSGTIAEAGGCQAATGSSNVAAANVGIAVIPAITADALQSSSTSTACAGGTNTQNNSSNVLNLQGAGLGVPAAGCANGTPNTSFTPLAPLLAIVCNADTSNGAQAGAPYGVRESLSLFVLNILGGNPLLKVVASGPESRAVAPTVPTTPTDPGGGGAPGTGGGTGSPGGGGNPGGGGDPGDGPGDLTTDGPGTGGELAFTGSNLILLALIGGTLILSGIALAGTAGRHRRATA